MSYLVKLVLLIAVGMGVSTLVQMGRNDAQPYRTGVAMGQMESIGPEADRAVVRDADAVVLNDLTFNWSGALAMLVLAVLLFAGDLKKLTLKAKGALSGAAVLALFAVSVGSTGCMRIPYEPQKFDTAKSNEEMFLIPLRGDTTKQAASQNEELLRKNLVFAKQVRIPQQWIQTGRWDTDGEWRDAAIVIKVDKSPVTREWTADPNSGTSNKNEAVWVMTSDQVELSTGWSCTARIASQDDAVKFLHNYPNGSLAGVMDSEIRSKLQTAFGLEVTDLPMSELRTKATPHILKTVDTVISAFKERGITITNMGITGGFVYKDKTIQDTMVKLFNSEQEKSIAQAETAAQGERNTKFLEMKKAEADGIKMVADAKAYEIDKARQSLDTYLKLKGLEIEGARIAKWDGKFPTYFMGTNGQSPAMLLQQPRE